MHSAKVKSVSESMTQPIHKVQLKFVSILLTIGSVQCIADKKKDITGSSPMEQKSHLTVEDGCST